MASKNIYPLIEAAKIIREEKTPGANTAERIGQMFLSVLDQFDNDKTATEEDIISEVDIGFLKKGQTIKANTTFTTLMKMMLKDIAVENNSFPYTFPVKF